VADRAFAARCPIDGTAITCAGSFDDEYLTGQCPTCGYGMRMVNTQTVRGETQLVRMPVPIPAGSDEHPSAVAQPPDKQGEPVKKDK
jgi:hypothetical protein